MNRGMSQTQANDWTLIAQCGQALEKSVERSKFDFGFISFRSEQAWYETQLFEVGAGQDLTECRLVGGQLSKSIHS